MTDREIGKDRIHQFARLLHCEPAVIEAMLDTYGLCDNESLNRIQTVIEMISWERHAPPAPTPGTTRVICTFGLAELHDIILRRVPSQTLHFWRGLINDELADREPGGAG